MAEFPTIRVAVETKEKLEQYRELYRLKSVSDGIDNLFYVNATQAQKISELLVDHQKEHDRHDLVDVRLDEVLKLEIKAIRDEMGFGEESSVIKFLLHHYMDTVTIGKATLIYARSLR